MLELQAPAKINLHLRITGLTEQGYHLLDTSFAYVDVCDVLHIEPAVELQVSCSDVMLNGEHNLVFRVLYALRERYGIHQGLRVHIDKRLPSQAGLGGGSSDAASALMAANNLWNLNLDLHELCTFAAPFGADIPCFLFGQASIASGIGDVLTPLTLPPEALHVVLAHPGVGLSTAAVFQRFDREHALLAGQLTPQGAKATMRAGLKGVSARLSYAQLPVGENALEVISEHMCPELARLLSAMRKEQTVSWMSGSGTACVALCENSTQAEEMAERLTAEHLAVWTHAGTLLTGHPILHGDMLMGNRKRTGA
ncbi:MAG: 4-(cytidine 5'-diphospho)-2-C-methyl-D-erythritol kinase [Mariprofundaceae bacterium]|nr:4-(cytidine 5'-diphospho)-2-C-methyl-D-erythritol kinase [Mariprofundaceae bacterium]